MAAPIPPVNLNLKDSLNSTSSATGGTIWGGAVNFAPQDTLSDKVTLGVVSSLLAVGVLHLMRRGAK